MGTRTVRVVIRVRPDKAPFMSENFINLCTGKKGFSYKGCRFFRCKPDDHVVCGDFEHQVGLGRPLPNRQRRTLNKLSSSTRSMQLSFHSRTPRVGGWVTTYLVHITFTRDVCTRSHFFFFFFFNFHFSQNGSGGHSAFDEARLFLAEQCPLKDHKVAYVPKKKKKTPFYQCNQS